MHDERVQALWQRFLSELSTQPEDVPPQFLELIQRPENRVPAEEPFCESAYTGAELRGYDHYWDSVSTHRTLLAAARREGRAIGLAKSKAETKRAVACAMRQQGIADAVISQVTGLSEEALRELV